MTGVKPLTPAQKVKALALVEDLRDVYRRHGIGDGVTESVCSLWHDAQAAVLLAEAAALHAREARRLDR